MAADDFSDWFVGKSEPISNVRRLAEDFLEPVIMQAIYEECRSLLGDRPTVEALCKAVATAVSVAEEMWEEFRPDAPDYACQKGCSWCCHQTVMVIGPEVIVVKRYIEEFFSAAERRVLIDRLGVRTEEIAGRTTSERLDFGIACGLLDDSVCSVHPARPMLCRGAYSEDAGFCAELFDRFDTVIEEVRSGERKGPFLVAPKILFNSAQVGLATALREIDYACRPLELTKALKIAFEIPNVGEAWLADESVLAGAELNKIDENYVTSGTGTVP